MSVRDVALRDYVDSIDGVYKLLFKDLPYDVARATIAERFVRSWHSLREPNACCLYRQSFDGCLDNDGGRTAGGEVVGDGRRVERIVGRSDEDWPSCGGSSGQSESRAVGSGARDDVVRGVNWSRNQAWKLAKKQKKLRRNSTVTNDKKTTEVNVDVESTVPEWRRQNVRALQHKGAFADCSDEVQRELRETRAKMLVEKNKTAVVEAEQRRRMLEARHKSRMIENEVERRRLELEVANEKLLEQKLAKLPKGFAETVISMGIEAAFENASVSSDSVSPNSSISAAELNEKNAALVALTTRVAELELECKNRSRTRPLRQTEKVYGGDGFGSWSRGVGFD